MYNQRLAMIVLALCMTFALWLKDRQTGTTSGLTVLSSCMTDDNVIQISGDVASPGIYILSDKKMTNSVIQMSKPLCDGLQTVVDGDLLSSLHAGQELQFLCQKAENRPSVQIKPISSSQRLTLGLPLDLNCMSEADFELLPGIGPVLAGKIVKYRQNNGEFRGVDELLMVDGIGEKKFQALSHFFKVPIQKEKSSKESSVSQ